MKKIIIINGSRNAGKTTIGKIVASSLQRTAFIDIDVLRDFVMFLPLKKSIPLNLENAVLITKNLLKKNMNVVMVYPLFAKERAYLEKNLQASNVEVYFFTLKPPLEIALSDRGRKITIDDKKRIREMYAKGGECTGEHLGKIIDNSTLSAEEAAQEILNNIK